MSGSPPVGGGRSDVSFFRELFKRETGMTPVEYRAHFAPMLVRERLALVAAVALRGGHRRRGRSGQACG